MSNSGEQVSNYEMLDAQQAEDYVRAAAVVLGADRGGSQIDGVHAAATPDSFRGKSDRVPVGYFRVDTDDGTTSYDVKLADLGDGKRLSVAQVERADYDGPADRSHIARSVHLRGTTSSRRHSYRLFNRTGKDGMGAAAVTAKTAAEKEQAATLFATMASDVKMALETRLSTTRPDLIEGIKTTAENMRMAHQKNGASRLLSKLVGRNELKL